MAVNLRGPAASVMATVTSNSHEDERSMSSAPTSAVVVPQYPVAVDPYASLHSVLTEYPATLGTGEYSYLRYRQYHPMPLIPDVPHSTTAHPSTTTGHHIFYSRNARLPDESACGIHQLPFPSSRYGEHDHMGENYVEGGFSCQYYQHAPSVTPTHLQQHVVDRAPPPIAYQHRYSIHPVHPIGFPAARNDSFDFSGRVHHMSEPPIEPVPVTTYDKLATYHDSSYGPPEYEGRADEPMGVHNASMQSEQNNVAALQGVPRCSSNADSPSPVQQEGTVASMRHRGRSLVNSVWTELMYQGDTDPRKTLVDILTTALEVVGYQPDCGPPHTTNGRPVMLAHPDEFKNPSSFLKIYGDPLCISDGGPQPKKGKNGNWQCSSCQNINFPRRFRCHKCSCLRDNAGDKIVADYARTVYKKLTEDLGPRAHLTSKSTQSQEMNLADEANEGVPVSELCNSSYRHASMPQVHELPQASSATQNSQPHRSLRSNKKHRPSDNQSCNNSHATAAFSQNATSPNIAEECSSTPRGAFNLPRRLGAARSRVVVPQQSNAGRLSPKLQSASTTCSSPNESTVGLTAAQHRPSRLTTFN